MGDSIWRTGYDSPLLLLHRHLLGDLGSVTVLSKLLSPEQLSQSSLSPTDLPGRQRSCSWARRPKGCAALGGVTSAGGVSSSPSQWPPPFSGPAATHFLHQAKTECRFTNGTAGEVRYLERYIYDRQEFVRFDSHRGICEAITELGEHTARAWNTRKERLEYLRAGVERCHSDYSVYEHFFTTRKVEPIVKISPTKSDRLAHHTLLICTAAGYYPQEATITWLKNGQEQAEGVGYADELQNADWTYQYQVMLETVPARGDIYSCQVEHSSLKDPITVQWEPQTSDSAQSKVWTGAVGAVLGLVFVAVGLYLYLKNKEVSPLLPPAGVLSSFLPQDPACGEAVPVASGPFAGGEDG